MSLLSNKPYKGSRDFFPEEMRSREWMFASLKNTVEKFGYQKYDAPVIEPLDIYLIKTSEEIVSQQIYSFEDRGNRKVAIRPEMTPTVSRMVASRFRELSKPIRWYSLPNLWRYERPGKGRLREHWQLNCDLFAAQDELAADVEILSLSAQILIDFGAKKNDFHIWVSHREILNLLFGKVLQLPQQQWAQIARIMDKQEKVSKEDYYQMLRLEGLQQEQISVLDDFLNRGQKFLQDYRDSLQEPADYIFELLEMLDKLGYGDFIRYQPSIVRGFDYYTGMVFEIFDNAPENKRSLFGGGRYNNLVSHFSKESANAVGFGLGDVTLEEFLRTHHLYKSFDSATQIFITSFPEQHLRLQAFQFATLLRDKGFKVELALSKSKLGSQFKTAKDKNIAWVLVCGENEFKQKTVALKNLKNGEQQEIKQSELLSFFEKAFS